MPDTRLISVSAENIAVFLACWLTICFERSERLFSAICPAYEPENVITVSGCIQQDSELEDSMIEIRMPRLSEKMTEGKLLLWNVSVGDHVEQGTQVAEVEADKANMEIEAPVSGVICNLHGKPGDMITVDDVLVELNEELSHTVEDADPDASVAQPKPQTEAIEPTESPLERREKRFAQGDEINQ